MTSQKSLKNNVNENDFKRSLTSSLLFPIIAFLVLFFMVTVPIISYVNTEDFIKTPIHPELQMFLGPGSTFDYSPELMFMGMVFCGMLTAIKSYFFLMSKKQVNVFLSLGVTRNTMYLNRTLCAVILLFASTFIPVFIVYLINIAKFGASAYLTSVFLYFFFALFISGLVGYGIGTFSMMCSGNIFEAGLVGISLSFIPAMLYNCFLVMNEVLLRGFITTGEGTFYVSVLIPFTFVMNIDGNIINGNRFSIHEMLGTINKDVLVKGEIPEYMLVDKFFIIPLVAWVIVALVLVVVSVTLINKRKAEHANSFGHFAVSRAVVSVFVFILSAYVVIGMLGYEFGIVAVFIFTILLTLAGFFVTQLIMTRKIKQFVKALPVYLVALGVALFAFIMIGTEYFGTYNKTPEKEDVKSVSISLHELDFFYNGAYPRNEYIISTDSNDIDMVIELFDLTKKDKEKNGDWVGEVIFAIEDKDGKIRYRDFPIYSADIYLTYLEKAYSSAFFDAVVEEQLLGFNEQNISANGKYSIHKNEDRVEYVEYVMVDKIDANEIAMVNYLDNTMVVETLREYDDEENAMHIIKGDDLARALYEDITKMTFNELFRNNDKPVAVIGRPTNVCFNGNTVLKPSTDESDKYMYGETTNVYEIINKADKNELVVRNVWTNLFVYPQMTNTINYFKETGREFEYQYDGKIKEILYSDISYAEAGKEYSEAVKSRFDGLGNHYFITSKVSFFRNEQFGQSDFNYLMDYIEAETDSMTLLKEVYNVAENPLKPIDKSKHQSVIDNTVPYYLTYKDNGKYIYIVYEDGTVVTHYLPEANVSALK